MNKDEIIPDIAMWNYRLKDSEVELIRTGLYKGLKHRKRKQLARLLCKSTKTWGRK